MRAPRYLAAFAAAAALLVAGCSSSTKGSPAASNTSGSAAASNSTSSSIAAGSAAQSAPNTSGAATSGAAGPSAGGESSASESSASESSASESSANGAGSSEAPSPSAASTTVGDSSGGLSKNSYTWFDTLCTGLAPIKGLQNAESTITSAASDPAKLKSVLENLFGTAGPSFTATASKLKDLPPPDFSGGKEFAAKAVPALTVIGADFTKAANAIKSASSTDPSALEAALEPFSTDMSKLGSTMDNIDVTPATQTAIDAIPSCKAVGLGTS